MSSVFTGFEYDIFISYRHNDNRSGWVTDFVNALQEELATTVKEPLSIYFDKNPHDGLLEMHHVDKSLEGKLRCLIFIPIISQTYCDPKSFAWQHEFCAFNARSLQDQFGRDISLSNGNVASRILPIKIHDLDPPDKSTIENEMGGVLRAIEFIYKEPGVNRPLKIDDKKEENQLKTSYRNQINKVANAVKEILNGIAQEPLSSASHSPKVQFKTGKVKPSKMLAVIAMLLLAVVSSYYVYLLRTAPKKAENTILVLPFKADQNDVSQSYLAPGITADIILEIGKIQDLSPLSRNTSYAYEKTNKSLKEVAEETGSRYVLSGSIQKAINKVRFYIELADPVSNKTIWSSRYDRELNEILDVQKEIALSVATALEIKLTDTERKNIGRYKTKNFEAYDLFLQAKLLSRAIQIDSNVHKQCQLLLEKALTIDPNFAEAYTLYAFNINEIATYWDLDGVEMSKKAEKAIAKAIELNPDSPDNYFVRGAINLFLKWNIQEAENDFEKAWAMTGQGNSVIQHCFCGFSQYKIMKGDFIGALGFVDTVLRLDPSYPYKEMEKFMSYYGLQDSVGMRAIRETGKPEYFIPIYHYDLKDYAKSVQAFQKNPSFIVLAHLGSAYFKAGMKAKSDSVLTAVYKLPDSRPHKDVMLALIHGARGEKQESLKWYKHAFNRRNYIVLYTRVIADLQLIREEPEVKEMLAGIGL